MTRFGRGAAIGAGVPLALAVLAGCSQAPSAEVGDCFNQADLAGDVTDLSPIPCEDPHDLEVFHVFDLPAGDYPGEDAVMEGAEAECEEVFDAYVGASFAESEIDYMYLRPTEDGWASADDREVICMLLASEPVTGSLKDAGR